MKKFKGIQAKGWKASSIKRYKHFRKDGKKGRVKSYMFVADLKKGKNTIHYVETVNTLQTFRDNIKKDAYRFDDDFD